jgi:hypothetical protein
MKHHALLVLARLFTFKNPLPNVAIALPKPEERMRQIECDLACLIRATHLQVNNAIKELKQPDSLPENKDRLLTIIADLTCSKVNLVKLSEKVR